jgi:hypothetical protein
MTSLRDDYLFVAAIDIGRTYSGYAFSSRDDFKKDPLKIVANQAWNAGSQRHLSLKTPTCLLLDDKEELVSFGYEAENKYSDIVIDRKQNEYLFFQHFKMQLYKNKVNNLCNLIKIASLICSKECRRSEKLYMYCGLYASGLMLLHFNKMINTGYNLFRSIGLLVVNKAA